LIVSIAEHVGLALANLSLRERLRSQSIRDQLTGLYNRRYMEESLERELVRARRAGRTVAVILADLDKFKSVNDTHGHDAGDELLKAVSHLFQAHLRAGDIVCRYGGEEFLFVLPEASLSAARTRAEELRASVSALSVPFRGGTLDAVSVSLGVAVFPDQGGSMTMLLQAADRALYRAKARGGNSVEIAQERPARSRTRRLAAAQPTEAIAADVSPAVGAAELLR
jgi:diguanylate cyclase (GGDEF)-like protein